MAPVPATIQPTLTEKENGMKKNKTKLKLIQPQGHPMEVELGKGLITGNFLAALVTSRAYQQQVVKNKKGKGAYLRKNKHKSKGRESYLIAA